MSSSKENFQYVITEPFPPPGSGIPTPEEVWGESYFDPFSLDHIPYPHDVIESIYHRYLGDGKMKFINDEGRVRIIEIEDPIDISRLSIEERTDLRDEIAQELYEHCRASSKRHNKNDTAYSESLLARFLAPYRNETHLLREAAQVTAQAMRIGLPFVRLQMGQKVWKYNLNRTIIYHPSNNT